MFFFVGRGVSPFAPSSASANPLAVSRNLAFFGWITSLGEMAWQATGGSCNRCEIFLNLYWGIMNNTCMPNAGDIEVIMWWQYFLILATGNCIHIYCFFSFDSTLRWCVGSTLEFLLFYFWCTSETRQPDAPQLRLFNCKAYLTLQLLRLANASMTGQQVERAYPMGGNRRHGRSIDVAFVLYFLCIYVYIKAMIF